MVFLWFSYCLPIYIYIYWNTSGTKQLRSTCPRFVGRATEKGQWRKVGHTKIIAKRTHMYTNTILEILLYNMILIYIIILYMYIYIYIFDFFWGVLRTNSKHTNRSWCFEKGPFTAQTWRQVCWKWTLRGSHLRRRKRRQRGRESNGKRWKRNNRESGQQKKVRNNFWQVFLDKNISYSFVI